MGIDIGMKSACIDLSYALGNGYQQEENDKQPIM